MELILTGLPVTAHEMEQRGVVNKVVPADQDVLEESLKTARLVAARSAPALRLAKHAVKTGESHIGSFSFPDCQEGISGFLEKRPARFLQE